NQLGPLDAAFHHHMTAVIVEREDAVEAAHVDEHARRAELLTAHRVAAAGHGDRLTARGRVADREADLVNSLWFDDGGDARRVELRVDVVDERSRVAIGN